MTCSYWNIGDIIVRRDGITFKVKQVHCDLIKKQYLCPNSESFKYNENSCIYCKREVLELQNYWGEKEKPYYWNKINFEEYVVKKIGKINDSI
jgi:hypothetical protein